jgi:hypothetical protein
MRRARHRGMIFAVALTAMLSFGLAWAEDCFFHTDDGCAVETHCIACLWHHGAKPVAPVIVAAGPPVGLVEAITFPETARPVEAVPGTVASRGPPTLT